MERVILVLFFVALSLSSYAGAETPLLRNNDELDQMFEIIKYVESNNEEDAVGDGGKAYGIVQIHKVCVEDINRIYNTHYTHQQAFDETCSKEMFNLYISEGIRRYKLKYCRSPTDEELVRMWNGGLYSGHLRKTTLKYLERYKKFKKIYNKEFSDNC